MIPTRRPLPLFAVVLLGICSLANAVPPGDIASASVDGRIVELRTDGGALVRITFLDENLLRVQATTGEEPAGAQNEKAPIVLDAEYPEVAVEATDHGTYHTFATPALELVVHISPVRLELRRVSDGRTLWKELKPLEIADSTTTQTLESGAGERFFGGGQQNGTFEFKGRLMEISYSGGWEEGDRPSPAPFYMSSRGYGVLRNTWADGEYDFRSDGYLTATHAEARFDAYYMVGESIHDVLDMYTRLTGRAPLLARWAFGYGDADCYNDGDNVDKPGTVPAGWSDGPTGTTPDVVASVAAKYREHYMPGGCILPNDV